jgi:hypothetical protein
VTESDALRPPLTLLVAAGLLGLEGLFLVLMAVLELLDLHGGRATLAVTTALFFVALGAGLGFCAWGLSQVRSWARGPVVAAQLIGVLLSFSFWGGDTTVAAVVILAVSVAALVGLLHPASTRALAAGDEADAR